jgi:chromosome segregation ATPase
LKVFSFSQKPEIEENQEFTDQYKSELHQLAEFTKKNSELESATKKTKTENDSLKRENLDLKLRLKERSTEIQEANLKLDKANKKWFLFSL